VITALVSLAYFVLNQRGGPTVGGTAIAIFTVSVTKPRRISLPVGLLCVLIFGVLGMGFARGSWMDPDNLIVATWCALAVAAGEATKNRRACAPRRAQPGAMCRRGWPGTCSTNSQNRPSRRWRTSGRRAEPRWTSLASTIGLLRQPDDRAAPTEPSVGLARRQGCE
jgi:hypothetical protein